MSQTQIERSFATAATVRVKKHCWNMIASRDVVVNGTRFTFSLPDYALGVVDPLASPASLSDVRLAV